MKACKLPPASQLQLTTRALQPEPVEGPFDIFKGVRIEGLGVRDFSFAQSRGAADA